jgi:hypothetical protein
MAAPPDLDKLARTYLDLWQDQLTGIAGDAELAETLARTLELMNAGAQAFAGQFNGQFDTRKDGTSPEADDSNSKSAAPSAPGAPGTKAPAPSPRPAESDLDEFARRLAGIEQRLARLEAKPQKPGGGPEKKTRKRKS